MAKNTKEALGEHCGQAWHPAFYHACEMIFIDIIRDEEVGSEEQSIYHQGCRAMLAMQNDVAVGAQQLSAMQEALLNNDSHEIPVSYQLAVLAPDVALKTNLGVATVFRNFEAVKLDRYPKYARAFSGGPAGLMV